MKHVRFLVAALAASSCATVPSGGPPIRSDGIAAFGQSTRVGPLVVTPQALVEDSRCPINVQCVWAGRLVLKTRIDGASWRESVDLTLGQPTVTHGIGITLVSAKPDTLAGTPVQPSDYRFAFVHAPAPIVGR